MSPDTVNTVSLDADASSVQSAMLTAENLFCERGERILFEKLSFELLEGQVLQVQGGNGTGKTTLMRILCGLNDSYEGDIYWYGNAIEEQVSDFFAALCYIGHRNGVSKVLTPLENLRWSCGLQEEVEDAAIFSALKEVGLRGYEDSQCYTLSAGQQQRVSLARLIVSSARLWVLDEPFTTLDAKGVRQLEALLQAHASSGGSVLVTTHHPLKLDALEILNLG